MIASSGGTAAIIAACTIGGGIAIFLLFMTFQLTRILESVKETIDGVRTEVVPLLSEVRTTVIDVNKELERVDGMLDSVGKITKTVERVTSLVEQAVSGPLVKVAAAGAGLAKAFRKVRGGGD
jgi:uncharacterized protein YoxC